MNKTYEKKRKKTLLTVLDYSCSFMCSSNLFFAVRIHCKGLVTWRCGEP